MSRKRVTRGSHRPTPEDDTMGVHLVDTVAVTPEGDNVHINVQVTMLAPPSPCIVQVFFSPDGGPYVLLYREGAPSIDDTVACTPPVYPVVYYDWYYVERSPSGELLVQSPSTRVVL